MQIIVLDELMGLFVLQMSQQREVDAIIKESDFNPLVLANVATNIRNGKASQLQEWRSTRKYLADLQDGDVKRPSSLYGRTYSKRTMGASMEMALNSFSNAEQTLLFLASMFESQPIPEVVFQMVFKSIHSSLAKFSRVSEQLEISNFIQIESEMLPWGTIPRRSWSIHTMRQNFIQKIKEKEISLMFAKLCEQIKLDNIVAILLVVYGQASWRDQAASKLGIPINGVEKDHSKLANLPSAPIKPFVWLLHAEPKEEWEKQSHQFSKQVSLNMLLS